MPSRTDSPANSQPACASTDCAESAEFWLFYPPNNQWRPYCGRHLIHLHPSIELKAWLHSGYARPIERGKPESPPASPESGRVAAFRDLIQETVDWATL